MPCGARIERRSSATRVTLADRVLRYEVTEVFRNEGNSVGEADFIFPLPAGAAFEDLKLSINGEMVSGETLGADQARGVYEDIVRRMRDPALVEWMGSGMLRARIFPIQPGEDKKIMVRYQSVATREGDALRIDGRRGGDFTLQYARSAAYGEPSSPTHVLRTRDDGNLHIVEAQGATSDVTVLLPLRRANTAGLTVLTNASSGESGFAMLTIAPPATTTRATPRDLTFVLDVSGSMQGRKLEQAKAAGQAVLSSLRPNDRFRLIDFSTDVHNFRTGWLDASADNLRDARRYLEALRAEGSTNISEALSSALSGNARDSERLPLVVFVTDGEPTVGERNPDAIAALGARLRGRARVFTVGVGTAVNASLVEQLALQGHGTAQFVRDEESVESAVSLLARRLAEPVLTDVRISASGVRLSRILPNGPIDVFAGQDLVVLARYDGTGDATIRLEGQSPSGPVTWSTRARFTDDTKSNPFVARLWAAQRIGWLAAEKRRSGGTSELDGEIRSLGERYGIPTEFSSYLVLEPGMVASATPTVRHLRDDAVMPVAAPMSSPPRSAIGAANAPTMAAADMRFEAARSSAVQREAKSVGALDAAGQTAERGNAISVRIIGNRRFTLANSLWTDARFTASTRTLRVKPYSALYFELLKRLPELQDIFAIGDRLIVAGRTVAIELVPTGEERVDAGQLAAWQRAW
jgi:Ca-activated chloride channel family protein